MAAPGQAPAGGPGLHQEAHRPSAGPGHPEERPYGLNWLEEDDGPLKSSGVDLIGLFYAILARYKIILLCAVIGAVAMGYYSARTYVPSYAASAKLYVLSGGESSITQAMLNMGSQLKWDYAELLSVWEVKERVLQKLQLNDYSYTRLGGTVGIYASQNSRLLTITAYSQDPARAQSIANAYAEVAREYVAEVMNVDKPSIASRALLPTTPTNTGSKKKSALMGFAIGSILPMVLFTIMYFLDDKIRTAEDVQQIVGLPTLAALPMEQTGNKKSKRRKGK